MKKFILETIPKYGQLTILLASTGLFAQSLKDEKLKNSLLKQIEKTKELEDKVKYLESEKVESIKNQWELIKLKTNANKLQNNIEKLNENQNTLNNNYELTEEIKRSLIEKSKELFENTFSESEKIVDIIQKVLESGKGNNFVLNSISDRLSNLSTLELFSVVQISGILVILFCLFTIINILIGDKIIIYFNLEVRFPRLAKFILIRRKFQNYYLVWNFSLIFLVLFIFIYLNFLILF